jgi:hypothetical protein
MGGTAAAPIWMTMRGRGQGADQHVALALDLGHCRLSDAELGSHVDLCQTGHKTFSRDRGHCLDQPCTRIGWRQDQR